MRRLFLLTLFLSLFAAGFGSHLAAQFENPSPDTTQVGEWLGLRKLPDTIYVRRGETARFKIIVFNRSDTFDMVDVKVSDPLVESCQRTIGDLPRDDDLSYFCSTEEIQVPFTNEATVTGNNVTNGKNDSASDTARVEVLELTTSVSADPEIMAAPGGPVAFSVAITNLSSVDVPLTRLDSTHFGDLADPLNENVSGNTCAQADGLPVLARDGGSFTCGFSFAVKGSSGEHAYSVTSAGEVGAGTTVDSSGTAVVTLFDVIGLSLTPEAERVIAGSSVELTVVVHNVDETSSVNILTLEDAVLGDVTPYGDCSLPQTMLPGESYSCSYEQQVTATAGDEQSFILSVTAETDGVPPIALSDQASATILAATPQVYLPVLNFIPRPTSCAAPLRIRTDTIYLFYPDTRNAIYWFVLTEELETTVKLTNFVPLDGQVTVYKGTGNGCDPATLEFIKADGSSNSDRNIPLGSQEPGNYYIHVYSGKDLSSDEAYSLFVQTR